MEHKFKVWDAEKKRWLSDIERCYLDEDGDVRIERSSYAGTWLERVHGEVVLYIGLNDKNGIEIYSGDIVSDGERNRLVKWSAQNAAFYMGHTESGRSFYKEFIECGQSQSDGPVHCDTLEVIGNKFQNPELLSPTAPQAGKD